MFVVCIYVHVCVYMNVKLCVYIYIYILEHGHSATQEQVTVAILAQGTNWAVAETQAFFISSSSFAVIA